MAKELKKQKMPLGVALILIGQVFGPIFGFFALLSFPGMLLPYLLSFFFNVVVIAGILLRAKWLPNAYILIAALFLIYSLFMLPANIESTYNLCLTISGESEAYCAGDSTMQSYMGIVFSFLFYLIIAWYLRTKKDYFNAPALLKQ